MKFNRFNSFLFAPAGEGDGGGGAAGAAGQSGNAPQAAGGEAGGGESGSQAGGEAGGGEGGSQAGGEAGGGEGGSAPEGGQQEAPQVPSLLQKVRSMAQDKGSLVARAEAAEKAKLKAEGELETVRQQLQASQERVTQLEGERGEIQRALDTAQAEQQTADQAAARQMAGAGFSQEEVPASEQHAETEEGIRERMLAETDPEQKFRLAQQLRAKRAEGAEG